MEKNKAGREQHHDEPDSLKDIASSLGLTEEEFTDHRAQMKSWLHKAMNECSDENGNPDPQKVKLYLQTNRFKYKPKVTTVIERIKGLLTGLLDKK